jgi:Fe-S oxidoreductase
VCGSQYLRPSIGLATLELFKKLKIEFAIPDVACCGLPASSQGALNEARAMACQNIMSLERGRYESIVVDDTSCATHFKEVPKLFQNDPAWLNRAHDVAQKIRDLSMTLLSRRLQDHLKLAPWTGGPVAFHDPCKAQYTQHLTNPPRELLSAIPNLKLVPITDADQCCGGAGTYSFTQSEISQAVLEQKVKNIIASGCSILVTSSASCLTQVAFGLRRKNSNIQVLHLTEFLMRALDKRN